MSMATDLQGLGVPPLLAERTANAGIGPITVNVQGSIYTTGYQIRNAQYLIYISSVSPTGVLSLPVIGSDNGALLGDDFVVANGTAAAVSIYPPSTVSIIGAGTSNAAGTPISVAANSVITIWAGPNTTTWIYK